MANRGELRRQRQMAFLDVSFHIEKFSQLQKEWKDNIIFLQLVVFLRAILKVLLYDEI